MVDADLRRPRQHRLFGLPNERGASMVAVGEAELLATLRPVDLVSRNGDGTADFDSWSSGKRAVTRLWVLTSGPIPPNPGEIVASQRFAQIVKTLGDEADVVLVDSPAMLAVGDTAALASEVDGLIFLVDMEKARRPMLQAAADQLYRLPCAMMGLVIRLEGGGVATTTTTTIGSDGHGDKSAPKAGSRPRCDAVAGTVGAAAPLPRPSVAPAAATVALSVLLRAGSESVPGRLALAVRPPQPGEDSRSRVRPARSGSRSRNHTISLTCP